MPDTVKILEALNDGFKTMHTKIDKKFDQCDKRLTEVETIMEIKKALCKKKKEDDQKKQDLKKETRDFWKPIIRIVSIAGIFALLSIAWAKIKAILDLVP